MKKISVPPKKIVVYHTGAMGDLIVSTAALKTLLTLFPDAEITLIGNSLWRSVLQPSQWPKITKFIECERKSLKKLIPYHQNAQSNTWEPGKNVPSLLRLLQDYSLGICLHNRSLRFTTALLAARVKTRVGTHKSWWPRLLYTHFTREPRTPIPMRDKCLNVLLSLDKDFVEQQKKYWKDRGLPSLTKMDTQKFKEKFGDSFVLINPTSSIREKAWSAKNFRAVVEDLRRKNQNPIVIGSPHETEWLEEVAAGQAPIYQASSIFDVYNLIASAKLLVTSTSSLQFVAASAQTQTLTLVGWADPVLWGPLGKNDLFIKAEPNHEDEEIKNDKSLDKIERWKKLETAAYDRISVQKVLETISCLLG